MVLRLSILFLSFLFLPVLGEAKEPSTIQAPHIEGTFIQLWSDHAQWTEGEWKKLFGYFRRLKINQLVVQWTVYDEVTFPSVLEKILSLSDSAGIKVLVGLAHHSDYWKKIQQPPEQVENYFKKKLARSQSIAQLLLPSVQKHASFAGWYIPEEVDDVNWKSEKAQLVLFAYLRDLSAHLKELTSDKLVAISGFSNATMSPPVFGKFWESLLEGSEIDVVLFQDGIGANKLLLEELPIYLEVIREATKKSSAQLQVVTEIFAQVAGQPVDNEPFQAIPAPLSRIKEQVRVASAFTPHLVAFSIPEYMTPLGGRRARKLFSDYLNHIKSLH